MTNKISPMAHVDSRASLGDDIEIGPFCVVGPHVKLGDRNRLDNHVVIDGHVTIGSDNRFHPGAIIGGEPQDISYQGSDTSLEIGNGNVFREGVTVNRGAEKDDGVTRIGNNNMLMANSHVAHNCQIQNHAILVNGVLLGGHVRVQDGVIISGNSVIHHFTTLGTLCFIGGGSRVTQDVPPYMLWVGADDSRVRAVNVVGLQRHGCSPETIRTIKQAHRILYRENKSIKFVVEAMREKLGNVWPKELSTLVDFLSEISSGRNGRRMEARKAA